MPDTPAPQRLMEVEIKLAFMEDMVEQLNELVFRQQQQIDALARELARVREQSAQGLAAPASLRDEIPPHY
ncbi:MAG: SlyX family protein [Alcaligenaceae bacterium]|nr:SlyX family protein [Alcaligenaceae bacterium SAGV5]MPS55341.1 SlyX family protein [Alcaligenaceae bacterium SAGV3]MPT57166.1 SlyX family protein [Alcaligenaceae bacterium]